MKSKFGDYTCKCGNELTLEREKKVNLCIQCEMKMAINYQIKQREIEKDISYCDNCGNRETSYACVNEKCLICNKGIQKIQ